MRLLRCPATVVLFVCFVVASWAARFFDRLELMARLSAFIEKN